MQLEEDYKKNQICLGQVQQSKRQNLRSTNKKIKYNRLLLQENIESWTCAIPYKESLIKSSNVEFKLNGNENQGNLSLPKVFYQLILQIKVSNLEVIGVKILHLYYKRSIYFIHWLSQNGTDQSRDYTRKNIEI